MSKKYFVTEKNIANLFYRLKKDIRRRINCKSNSCNKTSLVNYIRSNSIYNVFLNLSNFDLDLMLGAICDTICESDLYNIQFVPENSTVTCDDRDNKQIMTIFIRNEGEITLPAGYVFILGFTNVNEPYDIASGFCTIVGNEFTTKAPLAPGASFSITIISFSDICDPSLSVISITGDSLEPVDDLYLTLPNMDLKVSVISIDCNSESGRMTAEFNLEMMYSFDGPVSQPSQYSITWYLNGSPVNIIDYGGIATINVIGIGYASVLSENFSLLTVNTPWVVNPANIINISVEIDNGLCDEYEIGLEVIPLIPNVDSNLLSNMDSIIYEIPFYEISGNAQAQSCKNGVRTQLYNIVNEGNITLPSGTIFDLSWTGLPGGVTFVGNMVISVAIDGLTMTLLNDININGNFQFGIEIPDVSCNTPITGLDLTITTNDLFLNNVNQELVISIP